MNRFAALALLFLLTLTACLGERQEGVLVEKPETPAAPASFDPAAHRAEIEAWQKRRSERLQAEDGWLTLVGLHWIEEGKSRIGSAAGNDVVLAAAAPPSVGTIMLKAGKTTFEPATAVTIDGAPVQGSVELRDDHHESGPTIVQMGTMRFNVIRRGDRYGLRVKDANADSRVHFQGLQYFPIDSKWRVEARLEPHDPPKTIKIIDVTGMTTENASPGTLVFTIDGQEHRIDPIIEEGSDELFLIFRDATSRDTTYQAGRYLYTPMPGPDGKVIVDFNRAYNPPCAFTDFATCPLPPEQNRLPIRIEAGEKRYAGGH